MDVSQRGKKRKKKLSFFQYAKKESSRGRFGRGNQIDGDTYQYFLRVIALNRDDFSTKEDRDIFVNNVFDQITGEEVNYSCNQLVSRVIENLLPSVNDEVLERFLSAFCKDLRPICCNSFASHVLETTLITAVERGMVTTSSEPDVSTDSVVKNETTSKFNKWVVQISKFILNNLEEFAWDTYANHIIRTTLECLSGVPPGSTAGRSQKWDPTKKDASSNKPEMSMHNREVPPVYKDLLKEFGNRLIAWPQLAELAYSDLTSGLVQTLLYTLKAVDKRLTRQLIRKLLNECFVSGETSQEEDGDKKEENQANLDIPAMFHSEAAVRVMDAAIAVASPKLFTQLYAMCFINRLVVLSQSPLAKFPVQKLFAHCTEKIEFEAMFDEVADCFPAILASHNTGVILSIGQACTRLSTRQGQFIKHLMNALHCSEPENRQESLVHLIARFVTHEQWAADKETFRVNNHGSHLLQTMLMFNKPIKIVNGLMAMNVGDLKTMFCDSKGSHVMDAFMSSEFVGEKSRERLIRKLQGTYVSLACSKHGSRSVDAVWAAAGIKQKLLIMDELAPKEAILNGNQFGNILAMKFGLALYRRRREDWKDMQGKEHRKKQLFADIIGDIGKKRKVNSDS